MKYILAISGGVDSVVLLDMWSKQHASEHVIVCHFDHGIREESGDDAWFVRALAARYGLEYYEGNAKLGGRASEEAARTARYEFLYRLAEKYQATIVTAHHLDDLVETVAINLHRGTGWRGLAVLNRQGIARPLLNMTKRELYEYALTHHLEWVEDRTNHNRRYLRNQIRLLTYNLSAEIKQKLHHLRDEQVRIAHEIEAETAAGSRLNAQTRHRYIMSDTMVARELLRAYLVSMNLPTLTTPRADRLLLAIKTARTGSKIDAGQGIIVKFSSREFVAKML